MLRIRTALRGAIYDDTSIFERAIALYPKVIVLKLRYIVSSQEFTRLETALMQQVTSNPSPIWYRFPDPQGTPMPNACNNCATWPRTLGIAIPELSGLMERYIVAMESQGAERAY